MALFPGDPNDAVRAALDMMQELHDFNLLREISEQKPIHIGIGIHIGECMLGTVGEKDRLETTVISDAVNTASRLEGLTKSLGTTILISEETFDRLDEDLQKGAQFMGHHAIRGKEEKIVVYGILLEEPLDSGRL